MCEKFVRSARAVLPLLLASAGILAPAFAQQPSAKSAPPDATVPGFTVTVTYSQKAMDKLMAGKETVIVVGYLYGFPKQGTPKKLVDEVGQVDMGEVKDEIAPGAPATFDRIKLDPAMTKWFDTPGPQVLINVYSGRKSSPDNLLDCGIYEGALKAVQGQSIPIACKLIGE
ncbi:MAG: hypothetical protein P4K78_02145 [Terracidiphilus sp.]|nr:hypothetical protein [Terracidiphilus sp.]